MKRSPLDLLKSIFHPLIIREEDLSEGWEKELGGMVGEYLKSPTFKIKRYFWVLIRFFGMEGFQPTTLEGIGKQTHLHGDVELSKTGVFYLKRTAINLLKQKKHVEALWDFVREK